MIEELHHCLYGMQHSTSFITKWAL